MKNSIHLFRLLAFAIFVSFPSFSQNSLKFDGTKSFIIADTTAGALNGNDFTIELEIQANAGDQTSGVGTLISFVSQNNNQSQFTELAIGINAANDLVFTLDDGATQSILGGAFLNDDCTDLAFVKTGSTLNVYSQGVLLGNQSLNTLNSFNQVRIGLSYYTGSASNYYNGYMKDFRIWDSPRSETEINQLKDSTLLGNEPGLVTLYNMNQGIASGNNTNILFLEDGVGNANGFLSNFDKTGDNSNFVNDPCFISEPSIEAGTDLTICSNETIVLKASTNRIDSLDWNNNVKDGVPFKPTTDGYYVVIGFADDGSVLTDSLLITIKQAPDVEYKNDTILCDPAPVQLKASGAAQYDFGFGAVMYDTTTVFPSETAYFSVTGIAPNNCTDRDSVLIKVNSFPGLELPNDTTICAGDGITLTASGAASYDWDNGQSSDPSYYVEAINSRYVPITATSTGGVCVVEDSIFVGKGILPILNLSPDTTICRGEDLLIEASEFDFVDWGDGIQPGNDSLFKIPDHMYISLTVYDSAFCSTTDSIFVIVRNTPSFEISSNAPVCPGELLTLYTDGAQNYDYGQGPTKEETYSFVAETSGYYTVKAIQNNGCGGEDSVYVELHPRPAVSAGEDFVTCFNVAVALFGQLVEDEDYEWNNGIKNGEYFIPTESKEYIVSTVNDLGCRNSDTVLLTLTEETDEPKFYPTELVNVFTPNEDGINDFYTPFKSSFFSFEEIKEDINVYDMKILNRWGELLFSTQEYEKGWDGTDNGKPILDGTYFVHLIYLPDCTSKEKTYEKVQAIQVTR